MLGKAPLDSRLRGNDGDFLRAEDAENHEPHG